MKKKMHPIYDYSELKILMFKDWVKKFLDEEECFPVNFEYSLTNKCNLNCVWCTEKYFRNKYNNISIDTEIAKRSISEMSELGTKSITFEGGGEPTMHKNLLEIIKHTIDCNIEVGLITNGVKLNELYTGLGDLTYVRVSLDAYDSISFKKLKGLDKFDNIIRGINLMVNNCPDTIVGISYILKKPYNTNINKIRNLLDKLRDIGVDYIQFKPIMEFDENITTRKFTIYVDIVEEIENLKKEYEDNSFKIYISRGKPMPKFYPICYVHLIKGYVSPTGDVYLCCVRKLFEDNYGGKDKLVFGNLYENSFKEIWKSEKRKKILENIYRLGSEYTKRCPVCPYMNYNYLLEIMKEGNKYEMNNFI